MSLISDILPRLETVVLFIPFVKPDDDPEWVGDSVKRLGMHALVKTLQST